MTRDETVLLGVMLENERAPDNAEEILSVPGVGFGWIGPTDLSVSLGHPLEFEHPDIRGAVESLFTAGQEAGVPLGNSAGYAGAIEAALDAGYRMLMLGSEVSAARDVLGEALRTAHDYATSRPEVTGTL